MPPPIPHTFTLGTGTSPYRSQRPNHEESWPAKGGDSSPAKGRHLTSGMPRGSGVWEYLCGPSRVAIWDRALVLQQLHSFVGAQPQHLISPQLLLQGGQPVQLLQAWPGALAAAHHAGLAEGHKCPETRALGLVELEQ